jgi:hypothetical protein
MHSLYSHIDVVRITNLIEKWTKIVITNKKQFKIKVVLVKFV